MKLQRTEGDSMEDAIVGTFSYANIASKQAEFPLFFSLDPPTDLGKFRRKPVY